MAQEVERGTVSRRTTFTTSQGKTFTVAYNQCAQIDLNTYDVAMWFEKVEIIEEIRAEHEPNFGSFIRYNVQQLFPMYPWRSLLVKYLLFSLRSDFCDQRYRTPDTSIRASARKDVIIRWAKDAISKVPVGHQRCTTWIKSYCRKMEQTTDCCHLFTL
ncbi:hypothetical protein IF2G_10820 [Cordyceps javanica]|nr:hypothetical protein IF2G_10820 [Cordyceps javanica]